MWETGNWTSRRTDGGAFLERDSKGWWVYHTDAEGHLAIQSEAPLVFAPSAHPASFTTVNEAQQWAERHIPVR